MQAQVLGQTPNRLHTRSYFEPNNAHDNEFVFVGEASRRVAHVYFKPADSGKRCSTAKSINPPTATASGFRAAHLLDSQTA